MSAPVVEMVEVPVAYLRELEQEVRRLRGNANRSMKKSEAAAKAGAR